MNRKSIFCVLSLLVVAVTTATVSAYAGDGVKLPANGVIINPGGKNIVVREAPPKVSAFSYKLAGRLCSVGVGTIFEALKEVKIVNGEVWYRIHIDRRDVKNPIDWNRRNIDGWIAGRFRNKWAVSFLPEDIKRYASRHIAVSPTSSGLELPIDRTTIESVQPFTDEDERLMVMETAGQPTEEAETSSPESVEQPPDTGIDTSAVADIVGPPGLRDDDIQGGLSFLLRYLLLLAGSCTAVIVLAVERNQSLNIKKWFSPIIPFEFIILGLANIVFVALLLNTFVKNSETSVVFECITVFAGPNFGFMFIGFIVSVLLSKFMAFARK